MFTAFRRGPLHDSRNKPGTFHYGQGKLASTILFFEKLTVSVHKLSRKNKTRQVLLFPGYIDTLHMSLARSNVVPPAVRTSARARQPWRESSRRRILVVFPYEPVAYRCAPAHAVESCVRWRRFSSF